MDLVLDIGNSAVKGALFSGGEVQHAFRLDLSPGAAPTTDWQRALRGRLANTCPERAALSSVVPAATPRVRAVLQETWSLDPFCVHADVQLPFTLAYRTPATLGADRLAAAVAAWTHHGGDGRSVVALDVGTALTCEAVRAGAGGDGTYEGGAIAPGPALSQRALVGGTAQLPALHLDDLSPDDLSPDDLSPDDLSPDDALPAPVGTTTREALQSGLLYGFLDTAEGLLRRVAGVLGPPAPVVVSTGGWGAFLHARSERVTCHDPHLVLRGVHALLLLNADAQKRSY